MQSKKPERIQIKCPACGKQVEAVVNDGRVKRYCAIAKQGISYLIEEQCISGTQADVSKGTATTRVDRDNRGRFIPGSVPVNKKAKSP